MISSSKQCHNKNQYHFLSFLNNYFRLKIKCNGISFIILDANLCNCYSFDEKNPEPAPEIWKTMMWIERHWMKFLEHLNSLPYPAGIQMCHLFWCKEYHDDFWGQQGLQSRTQQKVRWQVSVWLSVKGQGKDYCVFFVVFFTGKKAFAEKSLHI